MEDYPHKDAVRSCGQHSQLEPLRWTWQELFKWSDGLSCGLLDSRVRRGDQILSLLCNDSENLVSFLAASRLQLEVGVSSQGGSIGVEKLKEWLGGKKAPRAVLTPTEVDGQDQIALFRKAVPHLQSIEWGEPLRSPEFSNLKTLVQTSFNRQIGFVTLRDMFVVDPLPNPLDRLEYGNENLPLFTNLDEKKTFTHADIVSKSVAIAELAQLTTLDRVMSTLDFNTTLGRTAMLAPLTAQAVLIISTSSNSRQFQAEQTLQHLATESVNVLITQPDHIEAMIDTPKFKSLTLNDKNHLLQRVFLSGAGDHSLVEKITTAFPQTKGSIHSLSK
eukprot:CAMPEP_0201547056 /NCGR_PEP_ID=MMETSP0173_2-20130828/3466_1 /ASSEMBLY_ACC=CAM_ASM_000268 /TAXON_ID=218659 /ORGANISM="Vexillifera sp., Strain DIVA3 564/2" /LENGTH=331 /DNA_ID=CAMNT_0047955969 /DNA_START=103 /DNA_END=1098 /DNA_ORIENTATION=-